MYVKFITFRRLLRQLLGFATRWEDMPRSSRNGRDIDLYEEVPTAVVVLPTYSKKWISKQEFAALITPFLSGNSRELI